MPSAKALSNMSETALGNILAKASKIPLNVKITQASDNLNSAGKGNFETTANEEFVKALIADRGVTGALDALSAGGHEGDAFRIVWDVLDDNYSYYNTAVNDAFIDLGIAYAQYLKAGGERLLDVAKYQADGADAGSVPDRLQTLHDNILGNFDELSITDKFGAAGDDAIFARIDAAGLKALIGEIGDYSDGRPIFSGNEGAAAQPTIIFDQQFFP